jgi:hypothetical protein
MIIEKIIVEGTIIRMTLIIKTLIKMKEMITTLVEVYKEDKKEFFEGITFVILWAMMTYFLLWFFIPTFAYDM